MPKAITYCKVDNCDTRCCGNGYCIRHYKQIKRHGKIFTSTYEKRPAVIEGNLAKIPLGVDAKDGYAFVDKEFAWVDKYNWHISPSGYAYSHSRKERRIMHRLVTNCPSDKDVDHADHNPLNNKLVNLRVCSPSENLRNMKLPSDNTSGYKGVCWEKRRGKWLVRVARKHVGYFDNKLEAAHAYNKHALAAFGEFANLNEIGVI